MAIVIGPLFTKIEEEDIGNTWFQEDGATCHTAEATHDVFRPVFEDRITVDGDRYRAMQSFE